METGAAFPKTLFCVTFNFFISKKKNFASAWTMILMSTNPAVIRTE